MSITTLSNPSEGAAVVEPRPGYTTTEFWTTAGTHAVAVLVILLSAFKAHWSHLSGVEGAIPLVAIIAAALGQVVYSLNRTKLKQTSMSKAVDLEIAKAKQLAPVVYKDGSSVLKDVTPVLGVVEAADPQVKPLVQRAEAVIEKVENVAKEVLQEAHKPTTTPPTATDVDAPVESTPAVDTSEDDSIPNYDPNVGETPGVVVSVPDAEPSKDALVPQADSTSAVVPVPVPSVPDATLVVHQDATPMV